LNTGTRALLHNCDVSTANIRVEDELGNRQANSQDAIRGVLACLKDIIITVSAETVGDLSQDN